MVRRGDRPGEGLHLGPQLWRRRVVLPGPALRLSEDRVPLGARVHPGGERGRG